MIPRPRCKRRSEAHSEGLAEISEHARAYIQDTVGTLYSGFVQGSRGLSRRRPASIDAAALHDLLSVYRRLCKMGEALFIWHTSADFADKEGRPRSLPRTGRLSLVSLAMRVTKSRYGASALVNDLINMQVLQRGKMTFRPRQRSAVISTNNAIAAAYAAVTMSRLIRTMQHNVAQAGPLRFERSVSEVNISQSDLPQFHAFARQQGEYFIDAVDDWLGHAARSQSKRGKTVPVGVGAFAWVDPPAGDHTKRRSSRDRSRASDRT